MAINLLEGKVVAPEGMKVGIIASRFNSFIVQKLLDGAVDGLVRHGVEESNIDAAWVPGAFEVPLMAQKMAESGKYDAVICVGAVIRGATSHYELVTNESAKGIAQVSLKSGVPVLFGIITTDEEGRITKFTEKPKKPDSNLASMGIYIFTTDLLLAALREDAVDQTSEHDFGKNIIPKLLDDGKRLYTYEFNGFWRDVGTISSYHETSMDLLGPNPAFDIFDEKFPIMSNASTRPPSFVGRNGEVEDCLVPNGCRILGKAKHSIISTDAVIGERATVVDSVLLPGAVVKDGAHVVRAILGENSVVEENVNLGSVDMTKDTAVIGNDVVVGKGEN